MQLRPASSVKSGHISYDLKNSSYISTSIKPMKCWRARGPSELNSHRRRGRCLQGRRRRISITCATTTRLVSLSWRSRIRPCKQGYVFGRPPVKPFVDPRRQPLWRARAKGRWRHLPGAPGSGDIEPLLLPQTKLLLKKALGPWSVSPLAYNRPSALCLTPLNHLRLDVEGFEP